MRMGLHVLLLVLAGATGCTFFNKPLNDDHLALESRAHNHTLAETFAVAAQPVAAAAPDTQS